MFHATELHFRFQTESSLADMKTICTKHPPFSILLSLRAQLDRSDSIYYKYLDLANFKSEPANLFLRKFEIMTTQLMLFHGICWSFLKDGANEPAEHVQEVAQSILKLLQNQRKEVPNMLSPEIIHRHISESYTEICFEEAQFLLNKCDVNTHCPVPAGVSSLNTILMYTLEKVRI